MKRLRLLFAFLAGIVLGGVGGAGGMLIAFPFLFPPPVVAEAAPVGATIVKVGTFEFDQKASGRDSLHWANGSGAVYRADGRATIRFDDNFEAGPGPNYWVYLNTVPVSHNGDFQADAKRVRIAQLKSFKRGQNYALPPDIDIGAFHTVTIWCESFQVYIGSAALPRS